MNFTIKKGKHYASILPIFLKPSHYGHYMCWIEFDKIQPTQDYYNKLIGIGCINPRIRSERIGWRFLDGQIELCIYSETNYKHTFIQPFTIPIKFDALRLQKPYVKFTLYFDQYSIGIGEAFKGYHQAENDFEELTCMLPLILCKPYHGGDPVAAQDYKITFAKI